MTFPTGFRYWKEQPFSHYIFQNKTGVFLGIFDPHGETACREKLNEILDLQVSGAAWSRRSLPTPYVRLPVTA